MEDEAKKEIKMLSAELLRLKNPSGAYGRNVAIDPCA
jgi:hypothetical protein